MLFLNSVKLREVSGSQSLKGPTIAQSKSILFDFDQTKIQIDVPQNQSKTSAESVSKNGTHKLESTNFKPLISDKRDWLAYVPLARYWDFYGPKFAGKLGDIDFNLAILKQKIKNDDVSFFHPRSFEFMIGDCLNYLFGSKIQLGEAVWKAPCNWQPLEALETIAVKFDVLRANGYLGSRHRYLLFPISNHHLVSVEARPFCNTVKNAGEKLSTHDMSNMDKLIDDIFDSVKVNLSPEAAAQQEAAMEGLEDRSLVKEYPPLKWYKTDLQVL